MKKILALLLVFVMVLSFAACSSDNGTTGGNNNTTGNAGGNTTGNGGNTTTTAATEVNYDELLAGDYGEITLWVSETSGVKEQFEEQIAAFQKLYPNIKFTYVVNTQGEGDAASQVISDVASAPDIYCFAQDQLARLVQAGALAPVADAFVDVVKAENVAGSVSAASVAGTLYAFPLTADNGYYLYYDTSIFSESDVEDLATMVKVAEEKGVKINFELENAWYNAAFFYATGCENTWTMNADGKTWSSVTDTYNSANGIIAMKGMQILAQSTCYQSNSNDFTGAGAVVTGTWNSKAAAEAFGDNLGATDLPSFTVDGNTYHLASYLGCKLMGVKPQSGDNATYKVAFLQLLATYLTNAENQLARFNEFGWGPSNLEAQANEAVVADASLTAFNKQAEYAVSQGNIHDSWWSLAASLGASARTETTDAGLQTALDNYTEAINALLVAKSEEELAIWSVIGAIDDTGWSVDYDMTQTSDTTWESEVLNFTDTEFKLRRGGEWTPQIGTDSDSSTGYRIKLDSNEDDPGNITVEAAGKYVIKLTWDGESAPVVEIIAQN